MADFSGGMEKNRPLCQFWYYFCFPDWKIFWNLSQKKEESPLFKDVINVKLFLFGLIFRSNPLYQVQWGGVPPKTLMSVCQCFILRLFKSTGINVHGDKVVGTKKSGKGRRKLGRKKRRMRSKIRHRKDWFIVASGMSESVLCRIQIFYCIPKNDKLYAFFHIILL